MAKILVAEDERDIRDLIQFTLMHAGHEVIAVGNGADAVEQALVHSPDLVMLDVRMPKMNGLDACRAIKGDPATEAITVVFLSAKGMDEEQSAGESAGAVDFIMKPFAPDELAQRVGAILSEIGAT